MILTRVSLGNISPSGFIDGLQNNSALRNATPKNPAAYDAKPAESGINPALPKVKVTESRAKGFLGDLQAGHVPKKG